MKGQLDTMRHLLEMELGDLRPPSALDNSMSLIAVVFGLLYNLLLYAQMNK